MNSKEVIMCLCEEMEKIELPPISEKVFQALSKQRQKYIEYTKKVEALNKQKNDKQRKYCHCYVKSHFSFSPSSFRILSLAIHLARFISAAF